MKKTKQLIWRYKKETNKVYAYKQINITNIIQFLKLKNYN